MKIPKKLINTKYRQIIWKESKKILKKIKTILPVESAYLVGSFSANKRRPADVDFIILVKTKEKNKKIKWAIDFQIVPNNKYGESIVSDIEKWMKQKYGSSNFKIIKI